MRISAFGRLVGRYRSLLIKLFRGSLLEMIAEPEVLDTPSFRQATWDIAKQMARESAIANASSWRAAAYRSPNSRKVYAALQEEFEGYGLQPVLNKIAFENAELIGSVPQYVARKISKHAQELVQQGKRPAEIKRELKLLAPHLAKGRIDMIARTEISRAETQLTVVRAERLGLEWGQWLTSNDMRVRTSHKNLENVLVRFDDPPQPEKLIGEHSTLGPGLPGSFPNCRCVLAPLVSLDEVKWPCRVFRKGSIKLMSRSQFTKLAGLPMAA